jgi:hypothetical protein
MSETATYHLACHCQAHVIRLDLPKDNPFDKAEVCDCSLCLKRRIVWMSVRGGSMSILRGVGKDGVKTKVYQMGSKTYHHQVSLALAHHGTEGS